MGAIARNIANNITTSGVFTSSAIANSSVTGITTLANASDGITFISSQTASNSATVSFTTGIDSTYKAYKFVFVNILPTVNNRDLAINFSTDGGSNYTAVCTTTHFGSYHPESDAYTGLEYYTGNDVAQGTNHTLFDNGGSGADEGSSGSLTLFNPSSTTYVKHFISAIAIGADATSATAFTAGYVNTTSAVNAVQFKFISTGNISAGKIYLYGIK